MATDGYRSGLSGKTVTDSVRRINYKAGGKNVAGTVLVYDSSAGFPTQSDWLLPENAVILDSSTSDIFVDASANVMYRYDGKSYVQMAGGGSMKWVDG